MTENVTSLDRRRYRPMEGSIVTVRWNSGRDNHKDEEIVGGTVIAAGAAKLWVHAPEDGVKVEQDVFIRYDHITHIERTA